MIKSVVNAFLLVLLFASCAGVPRSDMQISDNLPSIPSTEQPRQMWVLITVETSFPDGQLISSVESQYDKTGRLIVEETRDARSQITGRRLFENFPDGSQQVSVFSGTGDLVSRIRRETKNNLVVSEEVLDEAGGRQSSSTFQYDADGNRLVWEVFSGSGMIRTEYQNENGRPVAIQIFDGNRKLIKRYVLSYNAEGVLEQETEFDASNQVLRRIHYLYEDGVLIRESVHLASGAVRSSIEYVYDSNGNISESRFIDRNGRITEIRRHRWQLLTLSPVTP